MEKALNEWGSRSQLRKLPQFGGINLDASKYDGWFLREFPKIMPSGKPT